MQYDSEGFLYPSINKQKCTMCGMCEKICPAIQREKLEQIDQVRKYVTYVGYGNSPLTREKSTSGGVFFEIAKEILMQNGIVYGAAYNKEFHVYHKRVENMEQLDSIRKSKYVQSEIGLIYRLVKKDLESKKKVLFSGCGCQIVGLKNYLAKEYDNLYTVAIVCHGVPAPKVWDKYISTFRRVNNVDFRDKTMGWMEHQFNISTKKKDYVWKDENNPYMYAFIHDTIIRKSCFNCKFKGDRCKADLMIGDAWGIQQCCRSMFDDRGTSIIISYTDHGGNLLKKVHEKLAITSIESIELYSSNPRIVKSIKSNPGRAFYAKISRILPKVVCLNLMYVKGKLNEKKNRNINIS